MSSQLHDEYDLLGELGCSAGAAVWLARERPTGELVALRLDTDLAGDARTTDASVLRNLGAAVPAAERSCPLCLQTITDWRRFCGRCGADVAGIAEGGGEADSAGKALLLDEVRRQDLELLGRMTREEGGNAVFFAQHRTTGQILALTLQRGVGRDSAEGAYTIETGAFTAPRVTAAPLAPAPVDLPVPAAAAADQESRICPSCERVFGPDVRFCSHDGSVLRPETITDSLIGQVLGDRYHIIRALGRGGMGQVYLAEHVKMGRRCAVKVMHRALSQDSTAVSRFAREAANASRVNHPSVATIFDFGETSDRLIYLAMEYVEGESLSALLEREGPLGTRRGVGIAIHIADALTAAHQHGVVHRDLKPDNILIGRRGTVEHVKVVDFGIAKAMDAASNGLTQTGFVVGTPRYMSPEQLIAEEVDGRTDIYALGLVLFEMLVGTLPVGDKDGALNLTARLTEPPPSAREQNAAIPADLDEVLRKALGRKPAERYQTAAEFREALLACAPSVGTPSAGTYVGLNPAETGDAPVAATPAAAAAPAPAPLHAPAPTYASASSLESTAAGSAASAATRGALSSLLVRVGLAAAVLILSGAALWLMPGRAPSGTPETAQLTTSETVAEDPNFSDPTMASLPAAMPPVSESAPDGSTTATPPAATSPAPVAGPSPVVESAVRSPAASPPAASAAAPPPTPPPTPPVAEATPVQPTPARSFAAVAAAEVQRFGIALESGDMQRVRAVFGAGGLSADFDRELREVLEELTAPRVYVDPVDTSADALRMLFRMRVADGVSDETAFSALLDATFVSVDSGWLLIRITRR